MSNKRSSVALRERYDPTEDWMPAASAIDLAREAYFSEHPEAAPAKCPLPICGQHAYGVGAPCPMVGKEIKGRYGVGTHAPVLMVARKLR